MQQSNFRDQSERDVKGQREEGDSRTDRNQTQETQETDTALVGRCYNTVKIHTHKIKSNQIVVVTCFVNNRCRQTV